MCAGSWITKKDEAVRELVYRSDELSMGRSPFDHSGTMAASACLCTRPARIDVACAFSANQEPAVYAREWPLPVESDFAPFLEEAA